MRMLRDLILQLRDLNSLNGDPSLCWEKKILTLNIIEHVDFISNPFIAAFNPLFEIIRQVSKLNSFFKETYFTLDVHCVNGDKKYNPS